MSDFPSTLSALFSAVWRLEPDAFRALTMGPDGGKLALSALFISGISITLGQSVILFANQVGRIRFALSVVASALTLIVGVFFWALSIWAVLEFVVGVHRPIREAFIIVAAGHAPLFFGFLVLLPYLGRIIHIVLRVWTFLAVWVGVMTVYQTPAFMGLISVLLGWLLLEIITHFLPLLDDFEDWLWQLATGKRTMRSAQEMVDFYVQRSRERIEAAYKKERKGGGE
ncbi:MAG: hypothetical protein GXP42_17575 [Chloroflexi bacterium]|nr:hypothetical protein [Chloroflexota bacterium]